MSSRALCIVSWLLTSWNVSIAVTPSEVLTIDDACLAGKSSVKFDEVGSSACASKLFQKRAYWKTEAPVSERDAQTDDKDASWASTTMYPNSVRSFVPLPVHGHDETHLGRHHLVQTWQGQESLCHQGKIVPRLYVIGAMKSATTSLAENLRSIGIGAAPMNKGKEWNYVYDMTCRTDMPMDDIRNEWLNLLPPCPEAPAFQVWADFSVTTAQVAKLPDTMMHHPTMGLNAHGYFGRGWHASELISFMHGPETRFDLTIVIMLREPLARMQSEYYFFKYMYHKHDMRTKYAKMNDACAGCNYAFSPTLADALRLTIQEARKSSSNSPMQVTDWLWRSIYAPQIEAFSNFFHASQLLVIPYRQYLSYHTLWICQELKRRMQFLSDCWSVAGNETHVEHPSLEDDVSAELVQEFGMLMAPMNEHLVTVLTEVNAAGAILPGYIGPTGNMSQVKKWLEVSW